MAQLADDAIADRSPLPTHVPTTESRARFLERGSASLVPAAQLKHHVQMVGTRVVKSKAKSPPSLGSQEKAAGCDWAAWHVTLVDSHRDGHAADSGCRLMAAQA